MARADLDFVIRADRDRNYSVVHLAAANDARLSWKAAGILWYLISRPDGWRFRFSDLEAKHTDGRESLRSGLTELREGGYLRTPKRRAADGTVKGYVWVVSEKPLTEQEWTERIATAPEAGNPSSGEQPEDGFSVGGSPVVRKTRQRSRSPEVAVDQMKEIGAPLSSKANPKTYPPEFDELWRIHPRGPKQKAAAEWTKATAFGGEGSVRPDELLACLEAYVRTEISDRFRGHDLFRWIRDERWREYVDAEPKREDDDDSWRAREAGGGARVL